MMATALAYVGARETPAAAAVAWKASGLRRFVCCSPSNAARPSAPRRRSCCGGGWRRFVIGRYSVVDFLRHSPGRRLFRSRSGCASWSGGCSSATPGDAVDRSRAHLAEHSRAHAGEGWPGTCPSPSSCVRIGARACRRGHRAAGDQRAVSRPSSGTVALASGCHLDTLRRRHPRDGGVGIVALGR